MMCWESNISWRNGLTSISGSSTKSNEKSCTWRGVIWIESNFAKNHYGVLAGAPGVNKGSYILSCTGKRVASSGRAVITLITLALMQLHLEYFVQLGFLSTRTILTYWNKSHGGPPRRFGGLFHFKKKNLSASYCCFLLHSRSYRDKSDSSQKVIMKRGNGQMLQHRKFWSDTGKKNIHNEGSQILFCQPKSL